MKNTFTKTMIILVSLSMTAGNAFAFVGGAAGRFPVRGAQHFAASSRSFAAAGGARRFSLPGRGARFNSAPQYANFQRHPVKVNPNIHNFGGNNTAVHQYSQQTMSVNSIHTTHTGVVSSPVLGPRSVQPIEVNPRSSITINKNSPVIVNRNNSPVIVRGGGSWGRYPSTVIVRNPYPYHWNNYYYGYNNYNSVNTFLAVALGVSLFANVAQLAAASNHATNTVVYPAYYPADTMSVYQPVPYAAPTTFVPYASTGKSTGSSSSSGTSSAQSSQPVNVTINNTVNTTTAAPAATTTATTTEPTQEASVEPAVPVTFDGAAAPGSPDTAVNTATAANTASSASPAADQAATSSGTV